MSSPRPPRRRSSALETWSGAGYMAGGRPPRRGPPAKAWWLFLGAVLAAAAALARSAAVGDGNTNPPAERTLDIQEFAPDATTGR